MNSQTISDNLGARTDIPRVSVIVPAYNQSQYLAAAVDSVLRQTYHDYEIIVVDDGSTDDTPTVARGFGERVRTIRQENKGLAGARNTGIRAAQGELVALLDADDVWFSDFLETMVALIDGHPGASLVYCQARCMDSQGYELPQTRGGPPVAPETLYWTLLRANFLIPSTIVMRRSFVMAAGLFDQGLRSFEDWDLWLRTLPEHRFAGTAECLVGYRLHQSSLSTDPGGMQRANRAVIEKLFGPDDGQPQRWTREKRRAYGGVYRYHLLSSVQRCEDWQAGAGYLRLALQADPTLATDLEMFYELAMGSQPATSRGTSHQLRLDANAAQIERMLDAAFAGERPAKGPSLQARTYGTAYEALGLLGYNTGELSLSRRCLVKALRHRPDLAFDPAVTGNLAKSALGVNGLAWLRRWRHQLREMSST